ncbi:MAG: NUDIX domain-containing protein [Candidatus Spechtbacterales bacterium]
MGVLTFRQRPRSRRRQGNTPEVLLVQHTEAAHPRTGSYGLPGGTKEEGETAEAAALRELAEETGLTADSLVDLSGPDKLGAFYAPEDQLTGIRPAGKKPWEYDLYGLRVFLAGEVTGELVASDKTTPLWVPVGHLPRYSERLLPNVAQIIERGVEYWAS